MFASLASNIAEFHYSACVASRHMSLNVSMLTALQGQNVLLEASFLKVDLQPYNY